MSFPASSDPYILITNQDIEVVGDPIGAIQSIDVTENFNVPDSSSFSVPAYPEYMAQFVRGNRAVVIRDGEILSAGPIEQPGGYEWGVGGSGGGSDQDEPGFITVNFTDDSVHPASRRVYPDPAVAAASQTIGYYEATGNAETLIRNLVNLNAGPGALVARRTPSLILGSVAGVGTSVVVKSRFDPLGDVMRTLALSGGGLGFQVKQVGSDLVFTVFQPEDKTKTARFSRGIGNLRSIKYDISAPTATTALCGGTGEEDARTIVERNNATDEAAWWRSEIWVEATQQDGVVGGVEQAGDAALAENGEQTTLVTVTIDTEDVKYGRDFQMGDLVTVEVLPGIEIEDIVRSAHTTYTPGDGWETSVLVGSQDASRDPDWLQITRGIAARLGQLERR